jgi:hypothetical protein
MIEKTYLTMQKHRNSHILRVCVCVYVCVLVVVKFVLPYQKKRKRKKPLLHLFLSVKKPHGCNALCSVFLQFHVTGIYLYKKFLTISVALCTSNIYSLAINHCIFIHNEVCKPVYLYRLSTLYLSISFLKEHY